MHNDGYKAWSMELCCHLASPSLGHYASLSFIVRGRGRRSEVRGRRSVLLGSRHFNNFGFGNTQSAFRFGSLPSDY